MIVKCPLFLGEKKAQLVGVLGILVLILKCCSQVCYFTSLKVTGLHHWVINDSNTYHYCCSWNYIKWFLCFMYRKIYALFILQIFINNQALYINYLFLPPEQLSKVVLSLVKIKRQERSIICLFILND